MKKLADSNGVKSFRFRKNFSRVAVFAFCQLLKFRKKEQTLDVSVQ